MYSRVFRRFGFEAEVDAMQDAWQRGDRALAMAQIADHMVDALGVIGTADACREKVEAFAAAGVDEPIILPFTPEVDALSAYRQTISAFSA